MSSSNGAEFNDWMEEKFADSGGFTGLVLLLAMSEHSIEPITCSYVHVIGDETRWPDMKRMLDGSGRKWDAVVMFAESPPGGGPLIDVVAKARLQARIDEVTANRMTLNEGGMFDTQGRAIRIDPVEVN